MRQVRNHMLDLVMSANSAIVLDIEKSCARTKTQKGIFSASSLNSTIIFKCPNFEQERSVDTGNWEWHLISQLKGAASTPRKPIETGIFIPYSIAQREAGGVVLYLRQRNFDSLVQEFLGLNHKSDHPPSARDKAILDRLDEIPSLDPFLVKLALSREFPEIDHGFYNITEAEDDAVRETISKKVTPIVLKALRNSSAEKTPTEVFVNAIWNPEAREAELFVSAFGIAPSQSVVVFEAWRGISYYEWSYSRLRPLIIKILSWLRSSRSIPTDSGRVGSSMRRQIADLVRSTGNALLAQAKSADAFFSSYLENHRKFVDDGNPSGFREFLSSAQQSYWMLGWQVASLTHVVGIFSRAMTRSNDGQLSAESQQSMLIDITRSLERNMQPTSGDIGKIG
jgi:hypothetical protein